MTVHYPIVLETEANGAVSAYVPGLPVYAAADSRAKAERAIRDVLSAYLEAHPTSVNGSADPRGSVLEWSPTQGRHRRRCGADRRAAERDQGSRSARKWPARRSTSQGDRKATREGALRKP